MDRKYALNKLVGRKKIKGKINLLVEWEGKKACRTWEPRSVLRKDVPELVEEYEKRRKGVKSRNGKQMQLKDETFEEEEGTDRSFLVDNPSSGSIFKISWGCVGVAILILIFSFLRFLL